MSAPVDVRAVMEDAMPVYGSRFTHADFHAARDELHRLVNALGGTLMLLNRIIAADGFEDDLKSAKRVLQRELDRFGGVK